MRWRLFFFVLVIQLVYAKIRTSVLSSILGRCRCVIYCVYCEIFSHLCADVCHIGSTAYPHLQ